MKQDNKLIAILLALVGFFAFSITDASYKWLSSSSPVYTNIFICSAGALLLIATYGFLSGRGFSFWRTPKRHLHILRGILISVQILAIVSAFSNLQLTVVYPLLFCTPFFMAIFAKFLINEPLNRRMITTILIGFLGVCLVFRPELADLKNPWLLCALLGAVLGALINILARGIGQQEGNAYSFAVYTVIFVVIVSGILHFSLGTGLPSSGFSVYLLIIFAWIIGMIAIPLAFSKAPVIYVAPIQYSQILWGVVLGWIIFGDKPDTFAVIGITVIIMSGIVLLWEKNKKID